MTLRPQQLRQDRNKIQNRRNWAKVERYLTDLERSHGCAKSWEMRVRIEKGDITLKEMLGR